MTDALVGPIDYLAVEFPAARLEGKAMQAIVDLVEAGIIRVLDMRVAVVDADGVMSAVALSDLDGDGILDLAVFEGIESGLLGDDDLQESASLIAPGNGVGLIVYENTWAGPFVAALREVGAEVISSGRIPATEVLDALDQLEAAEGASEAGQPEPV
ncbi:hypothetical protein GCM10027053_08100 [Intrasporangium mesophilum]